MRQVGILLAQPGVNEIINNPVSTWRTYTPTITSEGGTAPTFASTTGMYMVVEKELHVIIQTGACSYSGTAGPYSFAIPAAFTINTTIHPISTLAATDGGNCTLYAPVGLATASAGGAAWQWVLNAVFVAGTTKVQVSAIPPAATADRAWSWGTGSSMDFASVNASLGLNFTVAIL